MSAIGDSIIKDGLDNVAKAINNLAAAVREGKATESQPVAEEPLTPERKEECRSINRRIAKTMDWLHANRKVCWNDPITWSDLDYVLSRILYNT